MLRVACGGLALQPLYLRHSASWQSRRIFAVPKAVLAGQTKFANNFSTTPAQRVPLAHDEDEDVVLGILESLMRKRELLHKQQDAQTNKEVAKSLGELDGLFDRWTEWQKLQKTAASLLRMTDPAIEGDADLRNMALEESEEILEQIQELRMQIRTDLLPHDETDDQSAIVEIRPGVGGDESAVFTAEVARMYTRFCEALYRPNGQRSFAVEQLSVTPTDTMAAGVRTDAFREVILSVNGRGAYGLLRYEGGVHRVQRVPVTVSVPKLQTSAIAVIVLPSVEESKGSSSREKGLDVVDPKDVKEEVMRSRGAGGQHVNKTESAIRLTHEPTGISVSMQDSRSQHQNRTKAWQVLRARLLDRKMREEMAQERDVRREQVTSTDRGDRIRTYNFPQDRVTDHRVPISTNNIDSILEGDASEETGLSLIISALRAKFEGESLRALKGRTELEVVQLAKGSS